MSVNEDWLVDLLTTRGELMAKVPELERSIKICEEISNG